MRSKFTAYVTDILKRWYSKYGFYRGLELHVWLLIALDRMHTVHADFYSSGFYDVPRVLISDARSFQALAPILDHVTHLASISCWYRSDVRQDRFRRSQAALLWIQKYKVMTMSVVGGQPKNSQIPVIKQQKTFHFSNVWLLLVYWAVPSCNIFFVINQTQM